MHYNSRMQNWVFTTPFSGKSILAKHNCKTNNDKVAHILESLILLTLIKFYLTIFVSVNPLWGHA